MLYEFILIRELKSKEIFREIEEKNKKKDKLHHISVVVNICMFFVELCLHFVLFLKTVLCVHSINSRFNPRNLFFF